MNRAICLLSGGVESSTLAYHLKKELKIKDIRFIFLDYNQRAKKEEEHCARKIAESLGHKLEKINIPWLGSISGSFINKSGEFPETNVEDIENLRKGEKDILNWWVPCRNSLFLLIGLAHAEASFLNEKKKYDVFIGIKKETFNAMKDNTKEFLGSMNNLVKHSTHHGFYKIDAPLIKYEKEEVVKLGNKLGVPFENTYSCYIGNNLEKGKVVHCGKCVNCRLRQHAFNWSMIKDKSSYKS